MRKLLFLAMLAGSFLVPYALTDKEWYPKLKAKWASLTGAQPGKPGEEGLLARVTNSTKAWFVKKPVDPLGAGPLVPNSPVTPLTGEPVADLRELIRFDVSPEWVFNRWGRVSTVLTEPGLEGLRVAVVSGPALDDIAGSLTYYFDAQRTVQRVTFRGVTGDGRRLADLVQTTYEFKPDRSVVAQQFSYRWSGKITSVLRLTHPPVVRAGQPHVRIEAMLEINRPNTRYGLSREMQQVVSADASFATR